jgi:UDP-galactose transporter B1
MLLGVLVARKRYPWIKYFYVMLIVLGVVLFMYKKPEKTTKVTDTSGIVGIGEFLLVRKKEREIFVLKFRI